MIVLYLVTLLLYCLSLCLSSHPLYIYILRAMSDPEMDCVLKEMDELV